MDTNENDVLTPSESVTVLPQTPPLPVVQQQLYSMQFWDNNPEASQARRMYIKILLQRTLLIAVTIFCVFSIYWGALWQLPARSLQGWVIDFDGDQVGQFVMPELKTLSGNIINWQIQQAVDFPNGPSDVASAVLDEKCWIAVTINPGATQNLNDSLASKNPSFNSSDVMTVYAIEARNENAFRTLLKPTVEISLEQITHAFAVRKMADLFASNTSIQTIAPEVLVRPIYFTVQNIRPFDTPVATAVTFVGLIYLLILSFFVVNSGILARTVSGIEKKLTTASLISVRIISPILMYLVLSCAYSLVTRAFHFPFDRRFGHAGFFIFWMLAWCGMMAAGLALESMITLLTIKYIQIFLVLCIIGNVSVCLWPLDALPVLYNYGKVAPFYQISRGVRTIAFSTKNQLGLNFGILFAWTAISCITLPLIQWYQRKGEVKAWKAKSVGV